MGEQKHPSYRMRHCRCWGQGEKGQAGYVAVRSLTSKHSPGHWEVSAVFQLWRGWAGCTAVFGPWVKDLWATGQVAWTPNHGSLHSPGVSVLKGPGPLHLPCPVPLTALLCCRACCRLAEHLHFLLPPSFCFLWFCFESAPGFLLLSILLFGGICCSVWWDMLLPLVGCAGASRPDPGVGGFKGLGRSPGPAHPTAPKTKPTTRGTEPELCWRGQSSLLMPGGTIVRLKRPCGVIPAHIFTSTSFLKSLPIPQHPSPSQKSRAMGQ